MVSKPRTSPILLAVLTGSLLVFILVLSSGAPLHAHPQPPPLARDNIPVMEVLKPDGTLDLDRGLSGTLAIAGWHVALDPMRGPVFTRPELAGEKWFSVGYQLDDYVKKIAISGNVVYAGGAFVKACLSASCSSKRTLNHIARWDGPVKGWTRLGYGLNGNVSDIALSGSDVYVGGAFTRACDDSTCVGGLTMNHIARWNGSSWAPLGHGMDGVVFDLTIIDSYVYAGGYFIKVCGNNACSGGNMTVNHIARWNGLFWSALDDGLDQAVWMLAGGGGNLYVGGTFKKVCGNRACDSGNTVVNYIAGWDGNNWFALGHGLGGGTIHAIAVSGSVVYAGGSNRWVCSNGACGLGKVANHIARWNGTSWSSLDNGLNEPVWDIALSGSDLYAGGTFKEVCGNEDCDAGNSTVNYIAKWNGSSWSSLDNGLDDVVSDVDVVGSDIYVGGYFWLACGNGACDSGNIRLNFVAKFGLPSPTRTRTPTPTKTITPTQTPTATATSNCTTRPPKPTLAAPPNNATLFTLRPRLKWNAAACALSYKVIVKNAATGQVADKVVSYTKLKYRTDPLQTNVYCKWFVQACNPFGCTKSAKRTLTLQ